MKAHHSHTTSSLYKALNPAHESKQMLAENEAPKTLQQLHRGLARRRHPETRDNRQSGLAQYHRLQRRR